MKKKLIALSLIASCLGGMLLGCGNKADTATTSADTEKVSDAVDATSAEASTDATNAEASTDTSTSGDKKYIAVISKGFQHQFWQVVAKGAEDAAKKYDVDITFEGPPSESDISQQVDMLNAALAKKPSAICLAALDTESVTSQLTDAASQGIPIVGFDSGVPNAPAGSVLSTVATNNADAAGLAAEEMFKEASINERIKAATAENPVTIAVQSQDATSASVMDRTQGFLDRMVALVNEVHPDAVSIKGHDIYKKDSTNPAAVILEVVIPPSTSYTDGQSAAQNELQNATNLIGYFCSNEASVTGILNATNDGSDFDRTNGKYKDIIVVGFDAGAPQKQAVKNQYFYGSITQDAYQIGYLAVETAVKVTNAESVEETIDPGCQFYTHANMDDPSIADLLYD